MVILVGLVCLDRTRHSLTELAAELPNHLSNAVRASRCVTGLLGHSSRSNSPLRISAITNSRMA